MSTEGWILFILILFFILFIVFAVFSVIYMYNLTQTINGIKDDVNTFSQYVPALEKFLCGYLPTLPFCKNL